LLCQGAFTAATPSIYRYNNLFHFIINNKTLRIIIINTIFLNRYGKNRQLTFKKLNKKQENENYIVFIPKIIIEYCTASQKQHIN